jgi:hypothetical protein
VTDTAEATGRKVRTLDRLVDLVSGGGERPGLARAGMNMHRLVDFYDPPVGYIGRLKTIRSISDLVIGDVKLTGICRPLASWRPYIDAVLAAPEKLADDLGLVEAQRSSFLAATGVDPLRRKALKTHGLEGLLWPALSSSQKENYLKYLLLQGQMLIAQVSILTVEFAVARDTAARAPDQSVYQYIYGPCLRARDFSLGDWSEALGRLPSVGLPDPSLPNPMHPEQYRKALGALIAECHRADGTKFLGLEKEDIRAALGSISAFIERGILGRKYRKRQHDVDERGNRRPVIVTTRTVDTNGESNTESPAAEIVTRTSGTAAEREELDRAGECPEDHLPRRQIILAEGGPRAAEHVRAAYDRANQLLPDRYEEPHPRQFDRLFSAMYPPHWRSFEYRKEMFELIAWIQTIFWLGCSPSQASGLMVGLPQTPLPTNFDFFLRMDDIEGDSESEFVPKTCVRVIEPPYVTEYVPINGERPRQSCFEIADLGNLAHSVRDMLAFANERPDLLNMREQAVKIFQESEETYVKRLSDFMESARLGFRISASELGKVLFQRAKEFGDIVSADLISCKNHHLAQVRRWYYTPTIEHLRAVHEGAVSSVMADLGETKWDEELATRRLPKDERYVGSRRCVEPEFLKQTVQDLRAIVEEVVAVRTGDDRRREFTIKHNALTVLAVWVIDISLGMRGTTHLYLHRSQYDCKTGFGSITEKGKARAFQLCQSARVIAEKYDRYIDGLAGFGLPRSSRALPCYFLEESDQKLQPVPVTPSSVKNFLSNLFRFEANWARRLVKTTALEEGLPAIYTDQYCGHSYRGEERHHPYGSFDPAPYFQAISEFTEHILQEIGLAPDSFNPSVVEPCP